MTDGGTDRWTDGQTDGQGAIISTICHSGTAMAYIIFMPLATSLAFIYLLTYFLKSVSIYSVRMQILTNAPRSTADVIRTQLVLTQSVATSATVNPAIKATEPTVQVRDKIQSCWNS